MSEETAKKRTIEILDNEMEIVLSEVGGQEVYKDGINYTRARSGRPRVYTEPEVREFAKVHPESGNPFDIWKLERSWRWLVGSRGCLIKY